MRVHEPHATQLLGGAAHDASCGAGHEQGAETQAQLVDEVGVDERPEEVRPALAEHLGEPPLGERAEHRGQVDGCLAAHEHVGDVLERSTPSDGRGGVGDDDGSHDGGREERMTRVEVERRGDDRDPGLLGQAVLASPRGIRLTDADPAVALDPHRARADEHHIGERAEHLHREPVVRVAETAARPSHGDSAVEARDEVHPHPRPGAVGQRVCLEQHAPVECRTLHLAHRLCSRNTGSRQPSIAPIIRIASTVSRTLCTRTMRAPCSTQ